MVIDRSNFIHELDQVDHCNWQLKLNTNIVMNADAKLEMFELKTQVQDNPVTLETFNERIYVEDFPEVRDSLLELINKKIDRFEVLYRIRIGNGQYKWIFEYYELSKSVDELVLGRTWNVSNLISAEVKLGDHEFDMLTQLPNRHKTIDILVDLIEDSKKSMKQVVLCVISVENIEKINSRASHGVGDYVLRRVADLLKEEGQLVGRIGSKSFLVVYTGVPTSMVNSTCGILIDNLQQMGTNIRETLVLKHSTREYWGEKVEALIEEMEQNNVS